MEQSIPPNLVSSATKTNFVKFSVALIFMYEAVRRQDIYIYSTKLVSTEN